jgi:hypothetical protein
MAFYLSPKQKRLLLELYAEVSPDTKLYDIDHMTRVEASKRIDYLLERKHGRRSDGRTVR